MSFVVLWRFRPRAGREVDFERVYSPAGDWAGFFRQGDGYLGTELLKGADGAYVTIDRWRDAPAYESFRADQRERYEALDRAFEQLTSEETPLGTFVDVAP